MFEKWRIQGAINYLLRCHKMGSTKPTLVENAFAQLVPRYAKIMRQKRISSDQAAVLLISETVCGLHIGDVTLMSIEQPELLRQIAVLFVSVEHLSRAKPHEFKEWFVEPEFVVCEYLRSKVSNA